MGQQDDKHHDDKNRRRKRKKRKRRLAFKVKSTLAAGGFVTMSSLALMGCEQSTVNPGPEGTVNPAPDTNYDVSGPDSGDARAGSGPPSGRGGPGGHA